MLEDYPNLTLKVTPGRTQTALGPIRDMCPHAHRIVKMHDYTYHNDNPCQGDHGQSIFHLLYGKMGLKKHRRRRILEDYPNLTLKVLLQRADCAGSRTLVTPTTHAMVIISSLSFPFYGNVGLKKYLH
ncbi:hypothetical protein BaRGS_00031189 [Batillaria attramentaria]|uniref:Uncharacterized protein n=1 Tax=Batillaria attramentaria TaxID=370345 RepID=A0ABD0JSF6_9CAEN